MSSEPQEHTLKSTTFPDFKKPQGIVDVNTELDSKTAQSAEQASADIETVAQKIIQLPTDLISKDPTSKFMTSRDVLRYHKALSLGIIRMVKTKKVIAPGGPEVTVEAMVNSIQGCPVCSIVTRSVFQMEWVEDVLLWHCFRCGLEINPFDKIAPEVLPEEQTEFGLSAIDDPGEKGRNGLDDDNKRPFPLYSNRKKKETTNAWSKLDNSRKKNDDLRRLRGRSKI